MSNQSKVYLGLTTTEKSDWREKIEETIKYNIEELTLFVTALDFKKRQELYRLLEETPVKNIPFVHLRHDSTLEEIEYFKRKFNTKLFNIHSSPDALDFYLTVKDRKEIIYIENTDHLGEEFFNCLPEFAGICVDFAHWEDYGVIQKDESYKNFGELLQKNKVDFCHIGSVRKTPYFRHYEYYSVHDNHYSAHYVEKLADFDYLKKYKQYFPLIMGIEVENSFREQLKMKEYLERKIL